MAQTLNLNYKISQLPSIKDLPLKEQQEEQINIINDWARENPTRVLGDDFLQLRQYLTLETWKYIMPLLGLSNDDILKNKKIPDFIKSNIFNNSIREVTDKAAKPIASTILAGASVPVVSGAMAGMNAVRAAYPFTTGLVDAYLSGEGVVRNLFGDSGVKKTYKLAKEGDTWGAVKSGTADALDLLGISDVFLLGKKIYNPLYRSAHAYNTIPQLGYNNALRRLKNWSRGLLSGTDPNIKKEAQWVDALRKEDYIGNGYLSPLYEIDPDAANEIFARGRDEASRLYNNLPLKHLYYIPNGDGTYRYNLEKILKDWKELSGTDVFPIDPHDFYSEELATSGHHGKDVITGAGGNLTGNSFITKKRIPINESGELVEFGIKLIEDVLDAHPFRREKDQFSDRLQTKVLDKASEKIRNKSNVIYTKLFDLTKLVNPKLNRFWYNYLGGAPLNLLRYTVDLKLPGYTGKGIEKNPGPFWKKVNKKMADFEVGSLTGATPFKMRTYIPYTYKTGQDLVFRGVGSPVEEMVLGYHSKNGYIPPIYQKLDIDNLLYLNGDNLKFAEDPLLTFNKNNLFIKTDKKKQGGKLNYLDYVGRTF